MNGVGLVLETAAVAAVLSTGAAVAALALVAVSARASATRRADVAFVAALAPALVVVVAVVAALLPSLLASLGLGGGDHCAAHDHHPHLCVTHFSGLRPLAAALGGATLALVVWRGVALVAQLTALASTVARLEALAVGTEQTDAGFPIVELPGAARICHAVGIRRRRMIVSAQARAALSASAWRAVCAHEDAHLARRDPLASVLVEAALVLAPPLLARALSRAFRGSVERACDEVAARALGGGLVIAEGLVEAARVLGRADDDPLATAATGHVLEERVTALIDVQLGARREPRAFSAAAGLLTALVVVATLGAGAVHHALESVLILFT